MPLTRHPASGARAATCRMDSGPDSVRILIQHFGAGITNEDFQKLVAPPSIDCRIGGP